MSAKEKIKITITRLMKSIDNNLKIKDDYIAIIESLKDILPQTSMISEAILDIFVEEIKKGNIDGGNFLNDVLENNTFSVSELLPYISDGSLPLKQYSFDTLIKIYFRKKNATFFKLIIKNVDFSDVRKDILMVILFKAMISNKKLLEDQEIFNMFTNLLDDSPLERVVNFLKSIKALLSKTPPKLLNVIINHINTFDIGGQTYIWNHTDRSLIDLFDKLKDKSYRIVGSFHYFKDDQHIAMIRDKETGYYGYVDNYGNIVIPTIFHMLSGIDKYNKMVMGKINSKIEGYEPGTYIIDSDFKITKR